MLPAFIGGFLGAYLAIHPGIVSAINFNILILLTIGAILMVPFFIGFIIFTVIDTVDRRRRAAEARMTDEQLAEVDRRSRILRQRFGGTTV